VPAMRANACRLIINLHTNLTTLSCSFWQRSNNLSLAQQQGIGSDRGYRCVQLGGNTSHRCVPCTQTYTRTYTHTHTHAHNAHTCTQNTRTHRCACIQGSFYRDCQPRSLHFTLGFHKCQPITKLSRSIIDDRPLISVGVTQPIVDIDRAVL